MKTCDRCGRTATRSLREISAVFVDSDWLPLWEATVSTGDLCPACLDGLEEKIRSFLNDRLPKEETT